MVDCAPARRASSPSWLGSDSDSFRRADRKEMELPAAAATEQGSQDDDRYQIPLFGKTKTNKSAEDQEKEVVNKAMIRRTRSWNRTSSASGWDLLKQNSSFKALVHKGRDDNQEVIEAEPMLGAIGSMGPTRIPSVHQVVRDAIKKAPVKNTIKVSFELPIHESYSLNKVCAR